MEENIETGIGSFIKRKLITTFATMLVFSIILASYGLLQDTSGEVYKPGNKFFQWVIIFLFYIGVVVLIYGNIVSIGIEFLQNKFFKKHDWLYVVILGIFGLANGLFFQERMFALYGMLAALLYAIVDKWLIKRFSESKSSVAFIILPIVLLFLMWGFFNFIY
ncbi:hypothetical protein [Neobacillus sp. YIM B06451]|uniref:hypothetical protein n=1 Tax=Neobacillus sp. YIM B06451 TaxID=3070994 RepID=UPI00292CB001|nr:hypothetical protein [Neobacillus sp. YIM B06451]